MNKLPFLAKTKKKTKISLKNLNKWNLILALVYFIQAVVVIVLSKNTTLPVNVHYLTADTLASQAAGHVVQAPAMRHLFDVNLAYLVAVFLLISTIAHLLVATIYRPQYEAGLKTGINRIRWVNYGLSFSAMIVAIALLVGVYDISSLIMLFGLIFVMNLLGLTMETYSQKSRQPSCLSFLIACIAGIIPWIVYVVYVIGSRAFGASVSPTFVYFILVSIFLLFDCFIINMYLQYKKPDKWVDYLYVERVYMILGLAIQTALAWQIFFGVLRP